MSCPPFPCRRRRSVDVWQWAFRCAWSWQQGSPTYPEAYWYIPCLAGKFSSVKLHFPLSPSSFSRVARHTWLPLRVRNLLHLVAEFFTAVPHALTLSLAEDGRLFSWGCGYFGRLGHGDRMHRYSPDFIKFFLSADVKTVACGGNHTAFIKTGTLSHRGGGAAFIS